MNEYARAAARVHAGLVALQAVPEGLRANYSDEFTRELYNARTIRKRHGLARMGYIAELTKMIAERCKPRGAYGLLPAAFAREVGKVTVEPDVGYEGELGEYQWWEELHAHGWYLELDAMNAASESEADDDDDDELNTPPSCSPTDRLHIVDPDAGSCRLRPVDLTGQPEDKTPERTAYPLRLVSPDLLRLFPEHGSPSPLSIPTDQPGPPSSPPAPAPCRKRSASVAHLDDGAIDKHKTLKLEAMESVLGLSPADVRPSMTPPQRPAPSPPVPVYYPSPVAGPSPLPANRPLQQQQIPVHHPPVRNLPSRSGSVYVPSSPSAVPIQNTSSGADTVSANNPSSSADTHSQSPSNDPTNLGKRAPKTLRKRQAAEEEALHQKDATTRTMLDLSAAIAGARANGAYTAVNLLGGRGMGSGGMAGPGLAKLVGPINGPAGAIGGMRSLQIASAATSEGADTNTTAGSTAGPSVPRSVSAATSVGAATSAAGATHAPKFVPAGTAIGSATCSVTPAREHAGVYRKPPSLPRKALPTRPKADVNLPTGPKAVAGLPTGPKADAGLPTGPRADAGLPTGPRAQTTLLTLIKPVSNLSVPAGPKATAPTSAPPVQRRVVSKLLPVPETNMALPVAAKSNPASVPPTPIYTAPDPEDFDPDVSMNSASSSRQDSSAPRKGSVADMPHSRRGDSYVTSYGDYHRPAASASAGWTGDSYRPGEVIDAYCPADLIATSMSSVPVYNATASSSTLCPPPPPPKPTLPIEKPVCMSDVRHPSCTTPLTPRALVAHMARAHGWDALRLPGAAEYICGGGGPGGMSIERDEFEKRVWDVVDGRVDLSEEGRRKRERSDSWRPAAVEAAYILSKGDSYRPGEEAPMGLLDREDEPPVCMADARDRQSGCARVPPGAGTVYAHMLRAHGWGALGTPGAREFICGGAPRRTEFEKRVWDVVDGRADLGAGKAEVRVKVERMEGAMEYGEDEGPPVCMADPAERRETCGMSMTPREVWAHMLSAHRWDALRPPAVAQYVCGSLNGPRVGRALFESRVREVMNGYIVRPARAQAQGNMKRVRGRRGGVGMYGGHGGLMAESMGGGGAYDH